MSVYEKERERKERNRQERRGEKEKQSGISFRAKGKKKSILTMVTEKKKVQMNTICPARN